MTFVASAIAGAAVLGAGASIYSSSKASSAQQNAAAQSAAAQQAGADKSIAAQKEMYQQGRTDLQPYREGGVAAQNQLMQMLGIGGDTTAANYGKYSKDFGMSDFTTDPGYQFRLEQGMKALNSSAAARGMGMSGANIKGATEYGQNLGSQEYQNAFNRYQTNRTAQLAPLQSLYAGGQAAAAGSAAQAGALGANLGQTYTGLGQGLGQAAVAGGNAQASGYLNQANAVTNALNQGMSSYTMNKYLGNLGGAGGGNGVNPLTYTPSDLSQINAANVSGFNQYGQY
tara:strand:+ start:579 stop:1433 length:855 start_codon:yes stop_codon:yes gene_type:complete